MELAGGFVAFVVAFVGADFEVMLRGVLSVRVSHFRGFFGVLEHRELFGETWGSMGSGTYWKEMLVGALYWGVCSVVGLRDACPPGAERGCKQRHISLTDRGVSIVPAPDNVVAPLQVLMRDAMVRAADIVVVFHLLPGDQCTLFPELLSSGQVKT